MTKATTLGILGAMQCKALMSARCGLVTFPRKGATRDVQYLLIYKAADHAHVLCRTIIKHRESQNLH